MTHRLLAADPDPSLTELYRIWFSRFGFEIATAASALECVERLRSFAPHVLILSLELQWGGSDGVLSMIQEDDRTPPIPVVLTCDKRSRSRAVRQLAPPVIKLLEKPILFLELHASIEAALGLNRIPVAQWLPCSCPADAVSDRE